jgi:2-oxoglutarate ferredoxin oxidoreductase subunit alpha
MIFFGTSTYAAEEAMDYIKEQGIVVDAMRLKSFPFTELVAQFVAQHEQVIVIEQNRDAQLKTLLMTELGTSASKLISVLKYDGFPITADHIFQSITQKLAIAQA